MLKQPEQNLFEKAEAFAAEAEAIFKNLPSIAQMKNRALSGENQEKFSKLADFLGRYDATEAIRGYERRN